MATSLEELLHRVCSGELPVAEASALLREQVLSRHADAAEALGFATVDHGRAQRCGAAEVIFGQGKTVDQVVAIAGAILAKQPAVLITRLRADHFKAVREAFAEVPQQAAERSGALLLGTPRCTAPDATPIPILVAGTSDLPVAEEAALTCIAHGQVPRVIADVGVAGLHRLLSQLDALREARVVIVVAGMEGALPSVVGGLVDVPVIAVPTSVGYGSSFGGVTALLGMLNSCASGVTVVNIDNGFGAAFAACRINRMVSLAGGDATENKGGFNSEAQHRG